MKESKVWAAWGILFLVSAGFGFLPNPHGLLKAVMVLLMLSFFVPPALLLHKGSSGTVRRVRNLSFVWLGTALAMLIINFLSVRLSEAAGNVAYGFMVVLSAPMVCGQYWVISMFFWACIMVKSVSMLKKKT